MANDIGSAWVSIQPSGAAQFQAQAQAMIAASMKAIKADVNVGANTTPALGKLAAMKSAVAAMQSNLSSMRANVDTTGAMSKVVALQVRAAALSKTLGSMSPGVSSDGLLSTESRMLAIAAATEKLTQDLDDSGNAAGNASRSYTLFGTILDKLSGSVSLYGGALEGMGPKLLSEIGGWHLLSEAVIETVTVWGLAAVAVGAFSIAAVPAAKAVVTQFEDMSTTSKALGVTIPGLSGNFSKMADAVKPEVYQLLGDALLVAQHSTGTFGDVAESTGNALDRLGARVVAALTSATSSGTLAKAASQDLYELGTAIGDLAGIIGALVKDVPGYAAILLKVGTAALGMAESFVQAAAPVIKIGLAAHGAIIYLGLLSTGITKLITGGLGMLSSMALKGALAVENLGPAGAAASKGLTTFGAAAEEAAALPWGQITIAAGLFVYFADKMGTATDATERFVQAQQNAVQQASLADVLAANSAALTAVNEKLATATTTYEKSVGGAATAQAAANKAISEAPALINPVTGSFSALGDQVVKAQSNVMELTAGQKAFEAQGQLVQSRVAALSSEFGGNSAAMALMNAAQITTSQLTDKNNSDWQQSVIMMQAQQAGFNEMQIGAGRYGAAMNALSNGLLTYDGNMSKVTSAQDTLMSAITSGESSFASYAEGINTLKGDADKGKVSISGLGSAALNMASDFYSQVTSSQQLIDSLENQGATTKQLTKAVATTSDQMLTYAGSNSAARATIISMINDAVGPGTVNFKNLDAWVKNNTGSMAALQGIVGQTTVQAASMSGAIDNLTKQLFEQDLMLASNVTPATKAYADAIENSGTQSDATKSARQQLINDLEKTGMSSQTAKGYVSGLTSQLSSLKGAAGQAGSALANYVKGSPYNARVMTTVGADGVVQVKGAGPGLNDVLAHLSFTGSSGNAAGGLMTMPGASSSVTGDNMIASVKSGELIIPSQHAPKFADMARTSGIKGFSGGGTIGSLNSSAVSAVNNTDQQGMQSGSQQVMAQAAKDMTSYVKNQMTATGGGASSASGVATSAQVVAWIVKALQIDGEPSWWLPYMEKLVSKESSGNPSAVDPIDVDGQNATGIAQMLPSTFAAHALPGYGNIMNGLDNMVSAIAYIKSEYGSPNNISGIGTSAAYKGYAAGGTLSEKILGFGVNTGMPYAFGSGEQVSPAGQANAGADGMPGMNQYQAAKLIQLMEAQNKILQGSPAAYSRSLNGAVGRAYNGAH
jgi:Transglycosylase SLT domain